MGGLGVRQKELEAAHPSLILPTFAAGWDSPIPQTLFVWGTLVITGKLDSYFVKHLIGETRVWWEVSLMTWPALALGFYICSVAGRLLRHHLPGTGEIRHLVDWSHCTGQSILLVQMLQDPR